MFSAKTPRNSDNFALRSPRHSANVSRKKLPPLVLCIARVPNVVAADGGSSTEKIHNVRGLRCALQANIRFVYLPTSYYVPDRGPGVGLIPR